MIIRLPYLPANEQGREVLVECIPSPLRCVSRPCSPFLQVKNQRFRGFEVTMKLLSSR